MKIIVVVASLIMPLWAASIIKMELPEGQIVIIEEQPIEATTNKKSPTTDIDVNDYRGPEQNLKSDIPENELLTNTFNGNTYKILTSKANGNREFLTADYEQAVKACHKLNTTPHSLLTFRSSEENAFVANWLFKELNIMTQVWIGLTRVNGTNDFVWADGAKLTPKNEKNLFKNWDKCEPNDITTTTWDVAGWGEDCVEMYSSYYPYPQRCDVIAKAGQWNDIPCRQIYNLVVCKGKSA